MIGDSLGTKPLLAWHEPIRWREAIAIVRTFSPSGYPTGAVTCWTGVAIANAVARVHAADTVHVCPTEYVSL